MWGNKIKIAALVSCVFLFFSFVSTVADESDINIVDVTFSYNENEVLSNRYTRPSKTTEKQQSMALEGFKKLAENNSLALYFREETGALRIEDKKGNYVWGSLESDKPDNLNKSWSSRAGSIVKIDTYDENGKKSAHGAAEALEISVNGKIINAAVKFSELSIGFSFTITLLEDGVNFAMDNSSITEEGAHKLASVVFMPFLGSTSGNEKEGYFFVPDGSGALIRFTKPRQYLMGFEKKIYGNDLGIDSLNTLTGGISNRQVDYLAAEETVSIPLFGVVHGEKQNAFYAVVEGGDAYSMIKAYPAGIIIDYNRIYNEFIYRQTYEQPVSKSGIGVQTLQKDRNEVSPAITYRFLSGEDADYVGMAKGYRSLLEKAEALEKKSSSMNDIPVNIDFLVGDVQKDFFGTSTKKITSLELIEGAVDWFDAHEVSHVNYALSGWQKGGLNGYSKSASSLSTVYGRLSVLDKLKDRIAEKGGRLLLNLSPFSAKQGQFEKRSEAGITLSQSAVTIKDNYGRFLGDSYYLKPAVGIESLDKQAGKLRPAKHDVLIDDVGYLLYGEYLSGAQMNRAETREMISESLSNLSSERKLNLVRPAAYLYKYSGSYYSTPMVSSQLIFETDTVPFLQIVLSGSVDMFSPYSNLSFYSGIDLLKMIDYNVYPSFLLTGLDNYNLRKTASSNLRSTRYDDWKDFIAGSYKLINNTLSNVRGQRIIGRAVISEGFVKNTYENGVVFVNYTDREMVHGGVTIPAMSAEFVKAGDLA